MVYKSVDHGKLWSICFLQYHLFFYEKPKTKQPALRDMLPDFYGLYSHRPQLSTNQRARIGSVIVKQLISSVGNLLSVRSKLQKRSSS